MIDISLTALVERLEPNCRNALVGATGECVTRTHYEVAIEHALLTMLDSPDDELRAIVGMFDVDWARLPQCLERNLKSRARGNSGRPVFSPFLVELLMDAWLIVSIEHRRESIGTAGLWAAVAGRPERFVDDETAVLLNRGGLSELRRRLDEVLPESGLAAGAGQSDGAAADNALTRFCVNFSAEARAGRIDPVLGRDSEIRQMIDILGRRRKNNPIVVGEPGVGKTALVEGLALKIADGRVPEFLRGVELMGLDLGALQAGASVRGEFENRLKGVICAVETMSRPVILFFDEAHTLIGAGGAPGSADAANLLKPALARGEFRAIAATTWKEYRKYFEKDAALSRRFQLVKLDTPTPVEAVTMLRGLRERFEQTHGIAIRDEAIEAAVQLASRHISGGQLPDKAIDVLDTTAARVRISRSGEPVEIECLSARIGALRREESGLARDSVAVGGSGDRARLDDIGRQLANLEEQRSALVARWNEEKALVHRIGELAEPWATAAARTRGGDLAGARSSPEAATHGGPPHDAERGDDEPAGDATEGGLSCAAAGDGDVAVLRSRLADLQGSVPMVHCEVTADAVARTVSDWTGVPLGAMVRSEAADALDFAVSLGSRVLGQQRAIGILDRELRISRAGLTDPDKPRGVFLLVGPSGVGKTATAIAIADIVFGGRRQLTVVNLSEYQESHTVSRLFGAPPGYVGYGEGGVLTEGVRREPYSIVLLDEAEKAHPDVLNAFYQAFDKGEMTDGEGRPIDFRNTIVLLTSNLCAELITQMMDREELPDAESMTDVLRPALAAHFKPALLARMRIVPYVPLTPRILREIVVQRLDLVGSRLRTQQGIELRLSEAAVEHAAARSARGDGGVRDIDALLNQSLLPRISTEILAAMNGGNTFSTVEVGLGEEGDWTYEFT